MTDHHTRLWFIAGLLAVLVLVPVLALAATTSPAAVQDGATFNATSGPEVTAGEDMSVATNTVFPDADTVSLGPVNVSGAEIDTNLTGADTSLPTIRPQASPSAALTLAHNNTSLSAAVTGGSIDSLALSDAATVGDSTRDIEIDTGGTGTTLTVSGLSGSQVVFIDTSGSQNQELATKSVTNGAASLSVGPNADRDILLAQSGATFDVAIDSTNSSIIEGQNLTVTATITNTGGAQATQSVTLDAGALGSASQSVTLAAGANATRTFNLSTSSGDDGTYTATVSSDDDSASESVTVLENIPNFQLTIDSSNAPIDGGDTLVVDVTVENTGAKSDTQTVALANGGTTRASTSVTLGRGASTTETLTWDTSGDTVGAVSTVRTDNDSQTLITTQDNWGEVNRFDTGSSGPVAISPDGSLVAHGDGSDVIVYDAQTETQVLQVTVASGLGALDWHPDGDRLAIGGNGNVHIYNLTADTLIDTISQPGGGLVHGAEWSPSGDRLLYLGEGGAARIAAADTLAVQRTESVGGHTYHDVAWSADGERFAAGGCSDFSVYQVGGGQLSHIDATIPDRSCGLNGLAFANNGESIVAASAVPDGGTFYDRSGNLKVFDVTSGARTDQIDDGQMHWDVESGPLGDRVAVVQPDVPRTEVFAVAGGELTSLRTFAANGDVGDQRLDVDWSHGGDHIADSPLDPSGWRVFTSLPVVDGTVTDSNGNPVDNVTIELSQNGQRTDAMVTDSNGAFTLIAPEDGSYNLTAAKVTGNQQIFETKQISVPDTGTTVPFTTTLIDTGISGRVVDAQGDPIPSATVTHNKTVDAVGVNTQGRFVFDTQTGGFLVSADAPGYRTDVATVSVAAGQVTGPVVLQLEEVTGVPIAGQVVDPQGNPIDGADVFVGPNQTSTNLQGNYVAEVGQTGSVVVTAATAVDSKTRTVTVSDPNGTTGVDFVLNRASGPGNASGNLILRSEQSGAILNNRSITVTFSNPVETSIRNTTTGVVDMAGLPLAAPVVASGETPGFAPRRIKIDSLAADRNLFLLDLTAVDSVVLSEFELDDRTGEFSGPDTNVTLEVRRPMPLPGETDNIPWRILLSDYVGAGDTIGMLMQPDERYRLRVRSESGNVREIGNYVPVRNKTVPLTIGELTWTLGDGEQNVSWAASQLNRSGSELLRFQYLDRATETTGLRLRIYATGNESREIYNQSFAGPLSNVTVTEPIPASAANVTSWTVAYNATRGNGTVAAEVVVGPARYPVDADSDWIPIFSALFLLFLSGFFSTKVANLGAIIVPGVATGLWAMGWLPVPLTWVLAALAIGVGAEFASRGGFSDQ